MDSARHSVSGDHDLPPVQTDRSVPNYELLADLAIQCAETPAAQVASLFTELVATIGRALAADGCVACVPDAADSTALKPTYYWTRRANDVPHPDVPDVEHLPWITSRMRQGEIVAAGTREDLPDPRDRDTLHRLGAGSCAAVPFSLGGLRGGIMLYSAESRPWGETTVQALRLAAGIFSLALGRAMPEAESAVTRRGPGPETAGAVVHRETSAMRSEADPIASSSDAIRRALTLARHVGPTSATVLLLGETGVGKEIFAQAIHDLSPRRSRPMIKVNCAALPATLLENELFGHERGAFTDAWARQIGRFEAAQGSTIFLDEIGELPREMQVKLLRVLQERTIERIGGGRPIRVDVRVIAATNCDLEGAVKTNAFREDLFYRLNVFPIRIPPLRDRLADIPSLVWAFIDELSPSLGRKIDAISADSLRDLQRYSWPGNIRELRNLVEREMIQSRSSTLTISVPVTPSASQTDGSATITDDAQAVHMKAVLDSCGWRIRGVRGAAERLNMKPTTLESRIARLGICRTEHSTAAREAGSLS